MKICCACKQSKRPAAFNVDRSRKDGRSVFCRSCAKLRNRQAYQANRAHYISKATSRKKALAATIRQLKQTTPCAECDKTFPYYVMEFDHLGDKNFCVGHHHRYGVKQVLTEIKKCEIVCSNCHRIRTYNRQSNK